MEVDLRHSERDKTTAMAVLDGNRWVAFAFRNGKAEFSMTEGGPVVPINTGWMTFDELVARLFPDVEATKAEMRSRVREAFEK